MLDSAAASPSTVAAISLSLAARLAAWMFAAAALLTEQQVAQVFAAAT
jgi:hypothetical protein